MSFFESIFAMDSPHLVNVDNYQTLENRKAMNRPTHAAIAGVMTEEDHRPTILIDFDGVIHKWSENEVFSKIPQNGIIEGTREAIEKLRNKFRIVIFTARVSFETNDNDKQKVEESKELVRDYLVNNNIYFDEISADKMPAVAYIDDRAIHFVNWSQCLSDLQNMVLI